VPDLRFEVLRVAPNARSIVPMLDFGLRVVDVAASPMGVRSIDLRCQIRIEPARRRYGTAEQEALRDIFGEPSRWGQSARPMLWTHVSAMVRSFQGTAEFTLPVECTYDFNVVGTRYFDALCGGDVPLCLLFSGMVFYEAESGLLQAAPIPWNCEAGFRLPVQTWKDMMQLHHRDTAWIGLRRDAFDALDEYKRRHALPTWEAAVESLLSAAPQATEEFAVREVLP